MFILLCSPHSFFLIELLTTSLILISFFFFSRIVTEKPHQGSVNKLLYCIVLYMMQILAHLSRFADTVKPSKKMFLVRRASVRAQEECSKFCLLERAPRRLLFFDFKLRKLFEGCALWIKCNRIVFFERVPLACVGGVRK